MGKNIGEIITLSPHREPILVWCLLAEVRLAEAEMGLAESQAESHHLHEMVHILGQYP